MSREHPLSPGRWTDLPTFVQRQVLFTVLFAAVLASIPITQLPVLSPAALLGAAGLLVATTTAAVVLPWRAWPPGWRSGVPPAAMLAVGLLRAATGGNTSPFAALLFLPAMALGAQARYRRQVVWVGIVALFVMLLPVLLGLDPVPVSAAAGLGTLITPLIVTASALAVHELTRNVRVRTVGVRELQQQQEVLLEQLHRDTEELAESGRAVRGARDAFSSVLDAVTEQAIIATDRRGEIRVFNPGAEKLLGWARPDVLRTRGITDLLAPAEGVPQLRLADLVAHADTGAADVRDATFRTATGGEVAVRLATTQRRDAEGEVVGYLFVATDTTAERQAAQLKDQFVSLVSHELRTPLSSILGYLELVLEDEELTLGAEQAGYLLVVQRNAVRLLDLVGDLLFTTQVEAGQLRVTEQDVDLTAVVAAALQTAQPAAARGGVRVHAQVPDDAVCVRGDALRLGQACDNLLSNAVKFTPVGGEVSVRLRPGDTDVLLSVADTGYGIAAEEVERLFTPFFRASTASRHSVAGIGLGLSITRAIVLAHHGSMEVASIEGAGTTFTVRLPLPAEVLRKS